MFPDPHCMYARPTRGSAFNQMELKLSSNTQWTNKFLMIYKLQNNRAQFINLHNLSGK